MRLGLLTGMGKDWRETLEKVRIAEDLGYEMIAGGEAWGAATIPWLAVLAANTTKLTLGTSILNVYSRTPAAIAQEYATLEEISGGRMMLGLGSSGAFVIEHFHGVPFDRPLRRLREYVEIFNMLIAGEPLNYDGQVFKMSRGFRIDYERPRGHVPVYIAGITPKSIRQTGEIADGILPIHWPAQQFEPLRAQLAEAARGVGRDPSALTIAPQTYVFVTDGKNDAEQWAAARRPLQYYINRMGVFYWQMLARNGYEAEVAASRAAWAQRDAAGSMAAISDRMVRDIEVIGPLESVKEQLEERAGLGADLQLLHMPQGSPREVGRLLEAFIR
jgi:alkanesulfonate monooxygenase SsuD/methylene tetrahydromethanopterin reductase-like flavin-dependent oxidoreductase (luciferase family)